MGETQNDAHSYRAQGPTPACIRRHEPVLYEMSAEQSRSLDRLAVERYAIPSIVLMENAAIGLRDHVLEMLSDQVDPSVWICCGPGNNGGDGFALARHLHNASVPVRAICTHQIERCTSDAAINRTILERMGIEICSAQELLDEHTQVFPTLIVDALFGTGLSRPIEGVAATLIGWINRSREKHGVRVLCVDLPSGLDADTGETLGTHAVLGDMTVTMAALKPCMSRVEVHEYLGDVRVVSIGVPIELLKELGTAIEPRHRK